MKMIKINRIFGVYLMVVGVFFQFLNIITYGYFGIDIDIFGALIFIVGLIIMIIWWKKK
jgi:hypothetical protein